MSNPEEVTERIRKLAEKDDELTKRRRKVRELRELLRLLPQGPGSGLNADMVDGKHAKDLISKGPTVIAGTSGGPASGGDMYRGTYDQNKNGIVDDSEKLGGKTLAEVQTAKIITTPTFAVVGTLAVGSDKAPTLVATCNLTITKVKLVVKTAPTGADLWVDVNKGDPPVTIFTNQANRPKIMAGNKKGDSGTPDVTSLAEGDELTVDIDQIGSGDAGADLTVEVVCEQSVVFS